MQRQQRLTLPSRRDVFGQVQVGADPVVGLRAEAEILAPVRVRFFALVSARRRPDLFRREPQKRRNPQAGGALPPLERGR